MIKKVANTRIKDRPNKVRAKLIIDVEGEYYDDEATVETLRYCVEQDLEDAGFNVIDSEIVDLANKELEQTRWIPVSERMPEDGTWNIWQSKTGALSIERYKEDALDHFFPSGRFFKLEETIAWMPVPEKYKEESK